MIFITRTVIKHSENQLLLLCFVVVNMTALLVIWAICYRWSLKMASSSRKYLLCYVHVGGKFTDDGASVKYVGGIMTTITIKEGTTYEEFMTSIASIVGKGSNEITVKFTLRFDRSIFVDLINDEGVDHLINFNEECGHVYVGEKENDGNTVIAMEDEFMFDAMHGVADVLTMSPPTLLDDNEESPSRACGTEMIPTPMPEMNSSKWKDIVVGEGQTFANAMSLREALYKYSIVEKFSYQFVKNNRQKIIVKCKVDGCPWYLGAYGMGERQDCEFLTIKTFISQHIHNAQDSLIVSHPVRSNLTSPIIIDCLRGNVDKTPHEIRRDLYREYGLQLDYNQAYRCKERALRDIHGRAEDSYTNIPWICKRLIETDPNTVARWECSEADKFERLFIAYGCSINGFLQGCRPILYIDGCHLSGPYRGTLLAANAYDADNELFPLAYAIVSGETYDEWSWFLQIVKDITRSIEVTIVSDRNNGIIRAVTNIFNGNRHAYCYRHVKENYAAEFVRMQKGKGRLSGIRKEDALNLLDGIAYARLDEDYRIAMGKLRSFSPRLAQWVETKGDVERWALSKFSPQRWDNITTNLAESFNAWILKERKHNMFVFILEHQRKLAKKMLASKMSMGNWKHGVGPNIEAKLKEAVARAENMEAEFWGGDKILVRGNSDRGSINLTVDLDAHICTCMAWQMSGVPCVHACAAIKKLHGNVYNFVDDCYKLSTQEKIYACSMMPIATHDCPRPGAPTVTELMTHKFLDPPCTKRPPGRPKRQRIESQFQQKKVYHCGRCHEAGHTIKTCKNPNPS